MKTEKLQKLKELLIEAVEVVDTMNDLELDVLADVEAIVKHDQRIVKQYNMVDLFKFLVFKKDLTTQFFDELEKHPGESAFQT